jgi:hypothetical protein
MWSSVPEGPGPLISQRERFQHFVDRGFERGKEERLHRDSPNRETLKAFRGIAPGHRIQSYEKRLKGGAKEPLDPFGVRHFGNSEDKEPGHFALKTPKSRNATCLWSRVVVMEEAVTWTEIWSGANRR